MEFLAHGLSGAATQRDGGEVLGDERKEMPGGACWNKVLREVADDSNTPARGSMDPSVPAAKQRSNMSIVSWRLGVHLVSCERTQRRDKRASRGSSQDQAGEEQQIELLLSIGTQLRDWVREDPEEEHRRW